jgi:hypothetical protein
LQEFDTSQRIFSLELGVCETHLAAIGMERSYSELFREKEFTERLKTQSEAKKALLEKFKARPGPDDPAVVARKAERDAILKAREERERQKEKERQERLAREAAERAVREAAERELRLAEEARLKAEAEAREAEERERISHQLVEEAERKAARDARYAARKARVRRGR